MSLQKETVKEVPIEKLSVEQLNYVGQQIEKEIKNYSQYYSSLRAVNNKYLDNKEYIKQLKEYKDKEILVPMTSSLYIPGKCADVKKLTIEIGANFFVETTIEKAEKFCDRKIENLKKNMADIDKIIQEKNDQLNVVNQNLIQKQVSQPKETKKETQQEKNDKKILEIISTLPNYNYLTSKYIEFPETMYNLLE